MQTQTVENARKAYEQGDWTRARALNDAFVGDDASSPATLADIGALAAEFLDYETADKAYRRLVDREPGNPGHRNLFATMLSQAGEFERAEAQLREALAGDKGHAFSYFNLSLIHKAGVDDPLISDLEDLLRKPDVSQSDQYAYRLALGKFYDDIGEFDQAFSHYDDAMRSPGISYNHGAQQAFFDKIKITYSRELFDRNEGAGDHSAAPIFFIGMPRSGSSLLEALLSRDPRIASLGERIELSLIVESIERRSPTSNNYLANIALMKADEFHQYGADYCRRLSPLARSAERFIDKNLLNFQRAGLIHLCLPHSTIIHTRRDPIDTCLSCFFQTLNPAIFPFTFDLAHIGQYYSIYADLMTYWEETIPDRIIEADYECVIDNPEAVIGALTEESGLAPMTNAGPEDARVKAIIATASAWQARQPVYETSVRRWKNYEKHLGPLFETLEVAGVSLTDAG